MKIINGLKIILMRGQFNYLRSDFCKTSISFQYQYNVLANFFLEGEYVFDKTCIRALNLDYFTSY